MSDQRALVPYTPPNHSDTVSLILRYPTSEQPFLVLDIRIKPMSAEPEAPASEIAEFIIPRLQKSLQDFFSSKLCRLVSEHAWRPRILLRSDEQQTVACSIVLVPLNDTCVDSSDMQVFNEYCKCSLQVLREQPGCLTWHLFRRFVL
jgi:hypothetical protein